VSAARRLRGGGALLLAACSGANAGQSDPQPCAPVEAQATGVSAAGLAGEYSLRLVATLGPKRGSTTGGRLTLVPYEASDPGAEGDSAGATSFTRPLRGTVEVKLDEVGAVAPGELAATEPAAPGVLVMEAPGRVIMRLGSEANRTDVRRFDGAFTALDVQQVSDDGFRGTWRSGGAGPAASGHFCAERSG
jgi:hypothetical protein